MFGCLCGTAIVLILSGRSIVLFSGAPRAMDYARGVILNQLEVIPLLRGHLAMSRYIFVYPTEWRDATGIQKPRVPPTIL